MTTANSIQHELGENADLLTCPDQWLENQRQDLTSQVSRILLELETVQKALYLKRQLQLNNQVAVLMSERDHEGNLRDVAIKIMTLPDAVNLLEQPQNDLDRAVLTAQFYVWTTDGLDTTSELRRSS